MKATVNYIIIVFTIIFVGCKKYPESKLWFKNPEKIAFIEGNLTHYIVNGIDSIDYLDNYFYNDINGNTYSHKFSDLSFRTTHAQKGYYEFYVDKPVDYAHVNAIINKIEYEYQSKGKKLKLFGTASILDGFKKNIFISDAIIWEIIYLKRKDTKHKMKGVYNGNTYEIQFN